MAEIEPDREIKEQGWTRMYALLFGEDIILVDDGREPPPPVDGVASYTAAEVGVLVKMKLKPPELKAMHLAKKVLGGVFMETAPEPGERPAAPIPPPRSCQQCGEWFWRPQGTGFACGWCTAPAREVVRDDRKKLLDLAHGATYPEMVLSPAARVRGCMESWERFVQFARAGAITASLDWFARRGKA